MIDIKILAEKSSQDRELYFTAIQVVSALSCNASVAFVTDADTISSYGEIRLPAFVINEKYIRWDRKPEPQEIPNILRRWADEESRCR